MKEEKSLCLNCIHADWDYYERREFVKPCKAARINPLLSECFEDCEEFPRATECAKYDAEPETMKIIITIKRDIYEGMKRAESIYRREEAPLQCMILDGEIIEGGENEV